MKKQIQKKTKQRINRYIMECKSLYIYNTYYDCFWINRYIMECKSRIGRDSKGVGIRINRYIMECKSSSLFNNSFFVSWINRYIMECKFWNIPSVFPALKELIDTLWNVNRYITPFFKIIYGN